MRKNVYKLKIELIGIILRENIILDTRYCIVCKQQRKIDATDHQTIEGEHFQCILLATLEEMMSHKEITSDIANKMQFNEMIKLM